jgi:hypothetical protein
MADPSHHTPFKPLVQTLSLYPRSNGNAVIKPTGAGATVIVYRMRLWCL